MKRMFSRRGVRSFVKSFFKLSSKERLFLKVMKSDMMKIEGRSPSATTAYR